MDLLRWLQAAREPVVGRFAVVDDAEVSLWEGGVRFAMHTPVGVVGLKFRSFEEGPSYASTASTTVAVELEDGATLSEPVEKVIRALLAALRKVDDGGFEVPKEEVEELEEHGAHVLPDKITEHVEAGQVSPPRDTEMFSLACVADQVALSDRWGDPEVAVVVLEGETWSGGRPLRGALDHAREAGEPVAIDARKASVETALAVVEACAGETWVYTTTEHAHAFVGRATHVYAQGGPVGPVDGTAWLVVEADELVQTGPVALPEGWGVLVVPGDPEQPGPLDALSEVIARIDSRVALAGLPLCVAPDHPRPAVHTVLLGSDPSGMVLTEVCRFCDLAGRCPGVGRSRHEAWGMRGVAPRFADDSQPPSVGPTDPRQ